MSAIERGDFLPMFSTPSSKTPNFDYGSLGSYDHLLVFLGSARPALGSQLVDTLVAMEGMLKRHNIFCFIVAGDPRDREDDRLQPLIDRYVVFWDADRSIHRRFGMVGPEPAGGGIAPTALAALMVRRNLRVEAIEAFAPVDSFTGRIERAITSLAPMPAPTEIGFQAPVLMIPDVFDRDLCRRLIALYETDGGVPSGFMRDENGVTKAFNDRNVKRRQDCWITDQALRLRIQRDLSRRVLPEIKKAFSFDATRIERFVIGCYDAQDQGFFRMHRDNTQLGTLHRRFAITINLNAEEYEGGQLWFPEFGPITYKASSGSAVIFSCSLLHEARPVTSGRRYAFLPFLYDDAAAEIRKRNRAHLSNADQEVGTLSAD
ncbi:MAG: 2OG-Fe(II) oxygenase [Thalassobaculaceae bacterium]|nr:2OG-Fe(II) oxygenase [Thalassobaculaceae bacterium]